MICEERRHTQTTIDTTRAEERAQSATLRALVAEWQEARKPVAHHSAGELTRAAHRQRAAEAALASYPVEGTR